MAEQTPTYTIGSLYQLPCADSQTEPKQPEEYLDSDARKDLVDSLRKQGVLQPILFGADKDGVPFIVAGEHKERSLSPQKTGTPHGKRKPWIARFTSQYDSLTAFVADMDPGALDTAARNDLISRIEELKRAADSLIARIRTAPGKEAKPGEAPARKKVKGGKEETGR